jgi:hypothetical protein
MSARRGGTVSVAGAPKARGLGRGSSPSAAPRPKLALEVNLVHDLDDDGAVVTPSAVVVARRKE